MLALTLALTSALVQQAPEVKTHVLIVAGVSGDSTFAKNFYEIGKRLADGVKTKYNVPDSMITFLAEQPDRDPQMIRGVSSKVEVEKAFAMIAKRVKPGDVVFVTLIGHGSSQDQKASMFNIPGADMNAADFAKLLEPLSQQLVIFVNTTSASGDFIGGLSGKNRVVITSTSSPMERNYAQFSKHFSAAFTAADTDADKDGNVSMLEAFEYTRLKVEKDYKSKSLLQSEHPTLDDNGDGKGVPMPERQAADGRFAARVYLTGPVAEDPKMSALLDEYAKLRLKIEGLIEAKAGAGETYGPQLEGMFVELAVLGLKIRQAGVGGKP